MFGIGGGIVIILVTIASVVTVIFGHTIATDTSGDTIGTTEEFATDIFTDTGETISKYYL
tara:strand:+ start:282 stop:461 length:180 start_codon:yes stop_codon:yes gene_type:complete